MKRVIYITSAVGTIIILLGGYFFVKDFFFTNALEHLPPPLISREESDSFGWKNDDPERWNVIYFEPIQLQEIEKAG